MDHQFQRSIQNAFKIKHFQNNEPTVGEIPVVVHDVGANLRVDLVEVSTKKDQSEDLHERVAENAVDVVEMRSVHPGRVAEIGRAHV